MKFFIKSPAFIVAILLIALGGGKSQVAGLIILLVGLVLCFLIELGCFGGNK